MDNSKNEGRTRDSFRKDARFPYSVNSRKSAISGLAMPTVATLVGKDDYRVIKRMSDESVPMNFLPVAVGAAAVRKVIFKGNETVVLFDGGERVSVVCSENDKYDEATAVAWALLKFSFGKNFNRQIHRIIEKVGVHAEDLRKAKGRAVKASLKVKSSNKKTAKKSAKKNSK